MAKSNEELKKEVEELNKQLKTKNTENSDLKKTSEDLSKKMKDFEAIKTKAKTDEEMIKNLTAENKNLAKTAVKSSDVPVLPGNGKNHVDKCTLICKTNLKGGRLKHEVYRLDTKDMEKIMMTVVYRDGDVDDTYFKPMPK